MAEDELGWWESILWNGIELSWTRLNRAHTELY